MVTIMMMIIIIIVKHAKIRIERLDELAINSIKFEEKKMKSLNKIQNSNRRYDILQNISEKKTYKKIMFRKYLQKNHLRNIYNKSFTKYLQKIIYKIYKIFPRNYSQKYFRKHNYKQTCNTGGWKTSTTRSQKTPCRHLGHVSWEFIWIYFFYLFVYYHILAAKTWPPNWLPNGLRSCIRR